MNKIITLIVICVCNIQFAYSQDSEYMDNNFSSGYNIMKYFENNLKDLDPIEGKYDVQFVAKTGSINAPDLHDYSTFYIVKHWPFKDWFYVYTETNGGSFRKGKFLKFNRLGETNAYRVYWNQSSCQAYLENRTRLNFVIPLNRDDVKTFSDNPYFTTWINLYYNMIKIYPTTSMYYNVK